MLPDIFDELTHGKVGYGWPMRSAPEPAPPGRRQIGRVRVDQGSEIDAEPFLEALEDFHPVQTLDADVATEPMIRLYPPRPGKPFTNAITSSVRSGMLSAPLQGTQTRSYAPSAHGCPACCGEARNAAPCGATDAPGAENLATNRSSAHSAASSI